jgi:hypothetical protein
LFCCSCLLFLMPCYCSSLEPISFLLGKKELKHQVLTEEKLDEISARLQFSPHKSLWCLGEKTRFQ